MKYNLQVKKVDNMTRHFSCISKNDDTELRLGLTKIQQMSENVRTNLTLVLLFIQTEAENGKTLKDSYLTNYKSTKFKLKFTGSKWIKSQLDILICV